MGMSPWKPDQDSPGPVFDDGRDLQEFEADLAHGASGQPRPGEHFPDEGHQDERRAVHEQPEAIGAEAMATRPSRAQVELEFLNAVFRVSPVDVEVVDLLRRAAEVGHA